ncbi:MAG: hypothetical protein ABIR57_15335 [Aeromicrobium sp.]
MWLKWYKFDAIVCIAMSPFLVILGIILILRNVGGDAGVTILVIGIVCAIVGPTTLHVFHKYPERFRS